jgi:hypothetical protein
LLRKTDFQEALDAVFNDTILEGKKDIKVNSGELHRTVGIYPKINHSMPVCCDVMMQNMREGDEILEQPNKGKGAKLTILYKLPR